MTESRLIRIRKTLYARIPIHEARRLGLRQGQSVDIQVRPLGGSVDDVLQLLGKYKGLFLRRPRRDMWRDDS